MRPSPLRSPRRPRKPRLARYRALGGLAALLATFVSLVGCAAPSAGAGGSKGWTMPWSKPAANQPTSYEQLSKDYQQRKISSPALGLDQSIEPNPIQSAASSVGASMKQGADKVASAMRPKPSAPTESTSESSSKLWPFSKKDEVSANFYIEMAQVYEKVDPEQAAGQYEKALEIEPKNIEALLAYAHLEDRTEKIEKAIELYQRAMTTHPKDPRAAHDLGLCYARHERYDDAIACLNKAIKLKPDRELYRNNIATVLVKMGRTDDAVSQISAVYGEAVARYNVALMLHGQGNREAATAQIVKALQIKPDLSQAQQWLTQLHAADEHQQMAESGFVQGPVAVAGGAYSGMNQIPQMATPTSAIMEPARAPRGPVAPSPGMMSPHAGPRSPQVPAAQAPAPPMPRVTQMSAQSDTDADTADAKQAVMTTILASDEK
jgi:Flp pilus assembly protein TadD